MNRRSFIRNSTAVATALTTGGFLKASGKGSQPLPPDKHNFQLKYAPHFGMFRHHAGEDLLDQLQFMSDTGFTAMEDNGMKERPVFVDQAEPHDT